MKTFGQFLLASSTASPSFADHLVEYYYGDSIAVGYGGNSPGTRRVGASPAEVYTQLQSDLKNNPDKFKGQSVNVSTGVSNNPSDFKSIERQLALLKKSGANVTVLGAAKGRYDKENERLASLSSSYGANFKGGFVAGKDGVHPKSYSSYDTGSKDTLPIPSAPVSTPKPSANTSSQPKVLSRLRGVTGSGAGADFKPRSWTDTETSRYKTYGGK